MTSASPPAPTGPIVVGVTGGSGAPIAVKLLQVLSETDLPVALIISNGGEAVLREECALYPRDLEALVDVTYDDGDIGAKVASGSSPTRGMVVVPCSGNTVAKIAHGFADSLITRAAQVHLKERRPLLLVPRETPLSVVQLRNLTTAAEVGATILMASPPFYLKASSVDTLVAYLVGKALDHLGVTHQLYRGWKSDEGPV
jgi:flavin prenyltransferase